MPHSVDEFLIWLRDVLGDHVQRRDVPREGRPPRWGESQPNTAPAGPGCVPSELGRDWPAVRQEIV